ncbi:RNA 2',3'-cyclic phosphodiesterase [Neptunomonas antarctica]|uniref:RNA 2',3'-cyclic phosphodiesterase n=1 Tax=Neptunomonas antarctica TaxID=619304 RepID=A0A1N7PHG4_9GAMM|nr:RNA 2',3'-cyclic phosphodiesterase [Neptunomonas antarctica]SIT10032.1 2'-5' RNA ligase [Neptunomonas antarctica]
MRLFIAIDIPDTVQQQISRLYCNFHGISWTPPERLHITLAFLGRVQKKKLPDLNRQLDKITFTPFTLCCDRFGSFQSGDVWLGITPEDSITQLHQRIVDALREIDMGFEGRLFKPHITLAYTKKNDEQQIMTVLENRRTFDTLSFTVDHFNLKSSWPRPSGSLHRIEAIYSRHSM